MFRKLVSNLPFSPALVGQLGFYAKRLRSEEATRRLGLIFTALALVVQSFAVITPPDSANASNPSDFAYGGVTTKEQLLHVYDSATRGTGDYDDLLNYAGITRDELVASKESTINSRQYGTSTDSWLTWGRVSRFSSSEGEVKHTVPRVNGGASTVYSRPLWRLDTSEYTSKKGTAYQAYVGYSTKIGNFAVLKDSGNIVTRSLPTPSPAAAFAEVTCESIRGIAYDARNKSAPVSVYLYFNGPPGKGKKVGPFTTAGSDNSFSMRVPDTYRSSRTTTTVWGVMVPLAGWNESTVQFRNTIQLPGNCLSTHASPTAVCAVLKSRIIDRTKVNLIASSSVANGASIKGYTFTVKDRAGKVVSQKTVTTNQTEAESGVIDLKTAGTYNGTVAVVTSLGEKTAPSCTMNVNVATTTSCMYSPSLPKTSEGCKPCPGNPQLWLHDTDCLQQSVQSKTAVNLTQNSDATKVTAQPGDRIQYTVYFENIGDVPTTVTFTEQLSDVMEYATIQDNGGGEYDAERKVLGWGSLGLAAGERQSRSFVINVKDEIPATPQGKSDASSYDCVMTNAFGTTVSVKVNCPQVKMAETVVSQLPRTGMGANIIFAASLLATVTFFWARSRQLNKEVRLIRKDFNMGTI